MDSLYEKLSNERKKMQEKGECPSFFSTGGWQLFKSKYLTDAKTPKEQYERIAKTLAKHAPTKPEGWENREWETEFFNILWKGWLSPSTPVLGNTGTNKGLPVSCSGNVMANDIYEIYATRAETAVLTKNCFGTATYLGDIAPRGTVSNKGVVCSGVVPIIKGFIDDMRYVSQGSKRRGAHASYLPVEHGDFWEVVALLNAEPDDMNIGWVISKEFRDKLDKGDKEAVKRFQEIMKVKMTTGRGYFFFPDKANELRPQWYKDQGLDIVAPQLCNEIMLHSSKDYTYTCVLSSMNLSKWDEWKDTDAVFIATVFLDCVVSEFLEKAEKLEGLEKAVAFTKKGRALGLGACGFHTYLQEHRMVFDSFETHMWNNTVFKHIGDESMRASKWMAEQWGEPEWCKGYGVRNTHRLAIAPTKSTALIMGGVSEGINPDPAMTYTQLTPAGEVDRANPVLLALMKERGVYDKKHFQELIDSQGSVQGVDWLTDEEKNVFKTAFEIDQRAIIRLAAARQRYVDQGQSLNLFFSADEDEGYIAEIHQEAFDNPYILGLYYCYSKAGVLASKGECSACQ
jgi:ribonucleoside-diphosphate reductase alpha chain